MRVGLGCQLTFEVPKPTPMIVLLNVHYSQVGFFEKPDHLVTDPGVPIESYRDLFGNWCNRLVAPTGRITLRTEGIIRYDGETDPIDLTAIQHPIEDLPADAIGYLLPSRYCETDLLSNEAWRLFEHTPPTGERVQAICDFVHNHITFGYQYGRSTKTAAQAYAEAQGVCRDYTHLAVTFCRAMNIPTRYCTGYISDINLPPPYATMDFAAWMECYLGGRWWTFDPRNNAPRWGRILIARGRDAADVPLTHTFGPNFLSDFSVWIDEIKA